MVRDPLKTTFSGLRQRLDRRSGSVVLLGCCGLLLSLSGAVWLGSGNGGRQQAEARPSLRELLNEVSSAKPKTLKDGDTTQRPVPPKAMGWRSPLKRQCRDENQRLADRLGALRKQLRHDRESIEIDSSNYGKRYRKDPWHQAINPMPRVIVLHETSNTLTSAINTFQTPHANDNDQVSYHTLIGREGRVVDVVDPLHRAYGAGYSAFLGEWAVTNPEFMGSVNNFALHLSLETPSDGYLGGRTHSGYTEEQYDALAVVLSDWMETFGINPEAITTHEHVDLGGERGDPRSFDWPQLQVRLASLQQLCRD